MIKHLDLFSGIGGFSLASDKVFASVEHTFVEIDPFCQSVLKKHWPNAKIYGDIKTFTTTDRYDLLTGGFPCQPFSQAGRRTGKDDDRWLWPSMFRIIQESRPTWVIGENVTGIKNMVLDEVLSDLESADYTCRAFVLPACAVGAPHKRERFFIVAHTNSRPSKEGDGFEQREWLPLPRVRSDFEESWPQIATELCRMDDGVPLGVDGDGKRKYTSRGKRLKSLGNAIVPRVAEQILRAIKNSL